MNLMEYKKGFNSKNCLHSFFAHGKWGQGCVSFCPPIRPHWFQERVWQNSQTLILTPTGSIWHLRKTFISLSVLCIELLLSIYIQRRHWSIQLVYITLEGIFIQRHDKKINRTFQTYLWKVPAGLLRMRKSISFGVASFPIYTYSHSLVCNMESVQWAHKKMHTCISLGIAPQRHFYPMHCKQRLTAKHGLLKCLLSKDIFPL